MALQVVNGQIADRGGPRRGEAAERWTLCTRAARAVINLRKRDIVHPLHELTPVLPHELVGTV
ncbi:hypothetical protein DIPPA_24234 [Diplonema papillatum]|nr:hypothetical protein DIPPA_24234 [Diplonema papillatum]